MKRKVKLNLEPVAPCYVQEFNNELKNNPNIAKKLRYVKYGNGYWESKKTFGVENYNYDKELLELENEIVKAIPAAREYMGWVICYC